MSADEGQRLASGLALIRAGRYFEAHEELELAWRAAPAQERDFYQGLVHVAVAWYQAGRGREVGAARQLDKAIRRLGPFAPAYRGVDVVAVIAQLETARVTVAGGSLELAALRLGQADVVERAVEGDVEPPVAMEEEQ
jgi:predicted metal-dependent hydrolase